MASHRRGPWSQAEDAYLMQLVHTQGALNWVRIAQTLGSRTPKQCRERYHQNLKPNLNHDPITPEEGLQIERLVHEIGKRWAEIARRLNGRSDNAVKNWWNGSQNRRKRLDRRRTTHPSSPFDDHHNLAGYPRPQVSLNRPLPHPVCTFASPQSPTYYRHYYGIEAPLLSPSTSEPASCEGLDGAPSLVSDCGSSFTASPRGPSSSPNLPVELPPLRTISVTPRPTLSLSGDSKLPGFNALPSPGYAAYEQRKLPPILQLPEGPAGASHLPTAPNSPVSLPQLHLPQSRCHSGDKDSRMNLSALLA